MIHCSVMSYLDYLSQFTTIFLNTLLPLILFAGVGAVADYFLKFELRSVARLTLYILSPALIFTALMKVEVPWSDAVRVAVFAMLVLTAMAGIGWLYAFLRGWDAATMSSTVLSVAFYNALNLGFPFALFAFGEEGLRLAAVLVVANSIPHNCFGLFVAARGVFTTRQALRAILRMPILYAILLAVLLRSIGAEVPATILGPMENLASAATPVLLLTIGMELGRVSLKGDGRGVRSAVILRLVIGPLIAWIASGLVGLDGLLRAVVILQASMPTAIMPIIFAREFGGNVPFVSRAVLYSTLFSAVPLVLILMFLRQTVLLGS